METPSPLPRPPVLAVTLVSATDAAHSARIARQLSGGVTSVESFAVDLPDSDSAEFAAELADELARQADDGENGITVISLDPVADPMEVALVLEHLCVRRHPGDTRIGVLDVVAVTSVDEVTRVLLGEGAEQGSEQEPPQWDRAERLATRLEFAGLIVLTDGDGAGASPAVDVLRALSPGAEILTERDLDRYRQRRAVLAPQRAHRLASDLGWQRALRGVPGDAGSVTTFVFRDPLPFHPGRLNTAVADDFVAHRVGRILRSRGLVRLASRADRVASWSIAGDVLSLDPTAIRSWSTDAPVGQEIVFLGRDLDVDELTRVLHGCLLTPRELLAGPDLWRTLADPFPRWEDEHQH
ncbi:GTP-binding protein [Rathayibacter festucae]|uniref:Cobalamin biosynthesis protein CobW n=1 Tax=Rathayibacter festucae DSM 15932 TaxID=1328866 RepID=A0A3Q9UYZ0_9MICO|nr:GTP-binding protein [Rathayibacter festucae]AZZ53129.1 cobalamin biosynthesis protein CobW [Rathayibacter festucae DSM 15932]